MGIRFAPSNLSDTEKLLEEILPIVLKQSERAIFCVPAGHGNRFIARIRVMISRKREVLRRARKPVLHFRLNTTVHPETHEGKRYDAIVIWMQRDDSHMISETLEDLLVNVI